MFLLRLNTEVSAVAVAPKFVDSKHCRYFVKSNDELSLSGSIDFSFRFLRSK